MVSHGFASHTSSITMRYLQIILTTMQLVHAEACKAILCVPMIFLFVENYIEVYVNGIMSSDTFAEVIKIYIQITPLH